MKILYYIVFILTVLCGVTFASLNAAPVAINYYIATSTLPLSVIVVISVGIGLAIGLLFCFYIYLKLKSEVFRLKHRVKLAKKEVNNLRVLPIKE